MIELKINENEQNQRLDKFLLKYLNKAPKSFIYKMLRKKRIKLNLKKASGNEIITIQDTLQLYISEETLNNFKENKVIRKFEKNFHIIYEDENIIICSKPVGLISQSDSNTSNSLNSQILYYLYANNNINKNEAFTPSICNRLDRNTSGIVTFGKNLSTLQTLNKAFKNNQVDKFYLCVVKGVIKQENIVKLYYLNKENNTVHLSKDYSEGSKEIITKYSPLKIKNGYTLLEVKLITGKTHQIRASLNYLGYPIIGDKKYGDKKVNVEVYNLFNLNSQFLHCYKIKFNLNDSNLNYLNDKNFISNSFNESFGKVLNYFQYKGEI